MSVKSGADYHELWPHAIREFLQACLKPLYELGARSAELGGQVQFGAERRARPRLILVAGARVKRPAVDGKESDPRVFPKSGLRAIAVVNVPIDDQDSIDPK